MNLLLDSHVVVWWVEANSRVKSEWLEPILDSSNTVFVSAATAWEIEIKKRSGTLSFGPTIVEVATGYAFELLPISVSDAVSAGSLERGMVFVTNDALLKQAPGIRTL